jgi:hypothetical protein
VADLKQELKRLRTELEVPPRIAREASGQ